MRRPNFATGLAVPAIGSEKRQKQNVSVSGTTSDIANTSTILPQLSLNVTQGNQVLTNGDVLLQEEGDAALQV